MALIEKINSDIKAAMLAKEKEKLEALRAVKAALLIANTSGDAVNEETEMKLLQKLVKQRRDSAAIYAEQNRQDLADIELSQLKYIEVYLPQQMSKEEIEAEIKTIISELAASGMKDMGKVMGAAAKKLAGKGDNKIISEIVKDLLS